ncbi:MAG: DUF3592 domain-containing protein [Candidatus Promineifilaceae bacterium]
MRMRTRSNSMGCGGTIIFILVFGAVGLGLFIGGALSFRAALSTQSWPTTEGRITSAQIYEDSDEDGTSYGLNVSYNYTVNDQRYTGTRIELTDYSSSRNYAEGLAEKYPVEAVVTVHYDPADPTKSVLETGANWVQYLLMGMGCCFGLMPLFMIPSLLRGRR